jgi:hypothetical protein
MPKKQAHTLKRALSMCNRALFGFRIAELWLEGELIVQVCYIHPIYEMFHFNGSTYMPRCRMANGSWSFV